MARVVRYNALTQPSAEQEHLDHQDHHLHQPLVSDGQSSSFATNIIEGSYRLSQTWNEFELKSHARQDGRLVSLKAIFFIVDG